MKDRHWYIIAVATIASLAIVALVSVVAATSKPAHPPQPSCSPGMVWNGAVCMLDESGIG
jgi:hypothetical protein